MSQFQPLRRGGVESFRGDANPYNDALVLSNFGISIPDGATITGIHFKVHRATLTGLAIDDSVRILKGGTPVGANRTQTGAWPTTLDYGSYGGAYRHSGQRAHIDSVRVTVFYTTPCD